MSDSTPLNNRKSTPSLIKIFSNSHGFALVAKSISHIEEYISRKLITRGVETLNEDNPNGVYNGKAALCINFEDDLPDLGIAMSEVVLRHCGYNVFNSGSHAELGSLNNIIVKEKNCNICR